MPYFVYNQTLNICSVLFLRLLSSLGIVKASFVHDPALYFDIFSCGRSFSRFLSMRCYLDAGRHVQRTLARRPPLPIEVEEEEKKKDNKNERGRTA